MSIRDWSSDVCSSDLLVCRIEHAYRPGTVDDRSTPPTSGVAAVPQDHRPQDPQEQEPAFDRRQLRHPQAPQGPGVAGQAPALSHALHAHQRSEEHTSELQSLMRISYAVFCLKKKKTNTTTTYQHNTNKTQITTRQ